MQNYQLLSKRHGVLLKLFSGLFILFLLFFQTAAAGIKSYDAPNGTEASKQYKVEVVQGNAVTTPFVYVSHAQIPKYNQSKTTSFSIFSFTGKVKIRVTKLDGDFEKGEVLPSSYGIVATKDKNTLEFTLEKPRKIAVEFDNSIEHPLLLFADEPEKDVPSAEDGNVIYFGPGEHHPEKPIQPKSGQTVYIAGGAIVHGLIYANNVSNVVVRGKGILSGRVFGHTHGKHIFFDGNSNDIVVKDLTIIDSPGYYVTIRGENAKVDNIKGLGWWFNTDGIALGPNGTITNCFLKCNDDAIKLYHSGLKVFNTTIWQMENGAPFQISWNMNSDNSGFVVKNCDVIHCDHFWDNTNTSVFNAIHGGSGHMSDYLFEDIRIENCDWRLVSLQIRENKFAKSESLGKISDVTFKNISVTTPGHKPLKRLNLIQGAGPEHSISNITFENLKINGQLIHNKTEGRFEIEPQSTSNIDFVVTQETTKQSANKAQAQPKVLSWENPLWKTGLNSYGAKDFFIWKEEGQYFLLATENPNIEWGKRGVILYASPDMINWHEEAYLLNRASIPENAWFKDGFGQPEMHRYKGKYYLVFNAYNDKNDPYGRLGICIAVSDNLRGPFTVINKDAPLAYGANTTLFIENDSVFAYWDLDGHFYMAPLNLPEAKFNTEPHIFLGPEQMGKDYRFLDAPSIFKDKDTYYLISSSFYSGYIIRVRYFTSTSAQGPWQLEKEPLMVWYEDEASMDVKMPWPAETPFPPPTQVIFHHHVFKGPGNNYFIAYHSSEKYSEPYLVIEPLEITRKGKLELPANKKVKQKVSL